MIRSRLVTGVAVVTAVAAGGVGGALIGVPGLSGAQTFPTAATAAATADPAGPMRGMHDHSALIDAAAKALNLTSQQLRDKLSDGKTTIADVAKQQNVDVNTVIDAIATADHDRISNIVNNPWPTFGDHPDGPGHFGPGPGFGMGHAGFGIIGDAFDSVAKALGITTDELKTDLGNGQSIADIAKAKNLDLNTIIDTLVNDANAKIGQAVKDGHLTQTEADAITPTIKPMITDLVNNSLPKGLGPMMGGGRFRFGRHGGFGGLPAPTPPAQPSTVPSA